MKEAKNSKIVAIVERERERAVFSKIEFIYDTFKKIENNKRIGLCAKSQRIIKKIKLLHDNLSFL